MKQQLFWILEEEDVAYTAVGEQAIIVVKLIGRGGGYLLAVGGRVVARDFDTIDGVEVYLHGHVPGYEIHSWIWQEIGAAGHPERRGSPQRWGYA